MTHLVNRARNAISRRCIGHRLRKKGCTISLAGAPAPRLIIDFDKPGSPLRSFSTRCDYLFIAKGEDNCGWVAPLELKRGRLDAAKVVGQLQEGACAAERLIFPAEPIRAPPRCGDWWSYVKVRTKQIKRETHSISRLRGGSSIVEVWRYAGSQASHLTVGSLIMGEALGIVSPKGFPRRQRTLERPNQT